jgi:hypothetical protein
MPGCCENYKFISDRAAGRLARIQADQSGNHDYQIRAKKRGINRRAKKATAYRPE